MVENGPFIVAVVFIILAIVAVAIGRRLGSVERGARAKGAQTQVVFRAKSQPQARVSPPKSKPDPSLLRPAEPDAGRNGFNPRVVAHNPNAPCWICGRSRSQCPGHE